MEFFIHVEPASKHDANCIQCNFWICKNDFFGHQTHTTLFPPFLLPSFVHPNCSSLSFNVHARPRPLFCFPLPAWQKKTFFLIIFYCRLGLGYKCNKGEPMFCRLFFIHCKLFEGFLLMPSLTSLQSFGRSWNPIKSAYGFGKVHFHSHFHNTNIKQHPHILFLLGACVRRVPDRSIWVVSPLKMLSVEMCTAFYTFYLPYIIQLIPIPNGAHFICTWTQEAGEGSFNPRRIPPQEEGSWKCENSHKCNE